MKKPFLNPKPIASVTYSTLKYQQKRNCPTSKNREPVASGPRNLLDEQFFSGMKMDRCVNYASAQNSGVSTELTLSISNHNPNNHKRKLEEFPRLSLSCSPTSKKQRAAECEDGEIISSMANNCTDFPVTRYLLDDRDYEAAETTRVSTELSLSLLNQNPENPNDDKKRIVGRLVDERAGIKDTRVSTKLKLFDESWVTSNTIAPVAIVLDPWMVKKELTASDVSKVQMRLLVSSGLVKLHILPLIRATEEDIDKGIDVRVWDCDTSTLHNLKFRRWHSSNGYVLKRKWWTEFVGRRELKENDTIGLYWNVAESRFHFSVLQRAAPQLV